MLVITAPAQPGSPMVMGESDGHPNNSSLCGLCLSDLTNTHGLQPLWINSHISNIDLLPLPSKSPFLDVWCASQTRCSPQEVIVRRQNANSQVLLLLKISPCLPRVFHQHRCLAGASPISQLPLPPVADLSFWNILWTSLHCPLRMRSAVASFTIFPNWKTPNVHRLVGEETNCAVSTQRNTTQPRQRTHQCTKRHGESQQH